jgi:hypothetical protein
MAYIPIVLLMFMISGLNAVAQTAHRGYGHAQQKDARVHIKPKKRKALQQVDFLNRGNLTQKKARDKKVERQNEREARAARDSANFLTPKERRALKKKQKALATRAFDIQDKPTQKRLKRHKRDALRRLRRAGYAP